MRLPLGVPFPSVFGCGRLPVPIGAEPEHPRDEKVSIADAKSVPQREQHPTAFAPGIPHRGVLNQIHEATKSGIRSSVAVHEPSGLSSHHVAAERERQHRRDARHEGKNRNQGRRVSKEFGATRCHPAVQEANDERH